MSDELPATPGATFAQPAHAKQPLVVVELDRRAVTLDGLETATCVQCGAARAEDHTALHVPGRFSSLSVRVGLCWPCSERTTAAYAKVARASRIVSGLSIAQLGALMFGIANGGGGLLFSSLSLLLVGTMGASFALRRRWLRDEPRLLAVGPTSVRLRVPRSWLRVLSDEKPRALVGSTSAPSAGGPRLPGPAARR